MEKSLRVSDTFHNNINTLSLQVNTKLQTDSLNITRVNNSTLYSDNIGFLNDINVRGDDAAVNTITSESGLGSVNFNQSSLDYDHTNDTLSVTVNDTNVLALQNQNTTVYKPLIVTGSIISSEIISGNWTSSTLNTTGSITIDGHLSRSKYIRVGNIVYFLLYIFTNDQSGTATFELPIASNFTSENDVTGIAIANVFEVYIVSGPGQFIDYIDADTTFNGIRYTRATNTPFVNNPLIYATGSYIVK